MAVPAGAEVATFANGCFWGTEHLYRKHYNNKGLLDARVGFIGGDKRFENPSYRQVCSGKTGHAEAAQLVFDPVRRPHVARVLTCAEEGDVRRAGRVLLPHA